MCIVCIGVWRWKSWELKSILKVPLDKNGKEQIYPSHILSLSSLFARSEQVQYEGAEVFADFLPLFKRSNIRARRYSQDFFCLSNTSAI
jgi:hypothetical protein